MFVLLIKSELNLSLLVVDKERSRHVREAALVITSTPQHPNIGFLIPQASLTEPPSIVPDRMVSLGILDLNPAHRKPLLVGGKVDGAIETHLSSQAQPLVCGGPSTDKSIISIEVLGNLLEGSVARLDVEEIDNRELNREPNTVAAMLLAFS